jgi:hypothetical protein
MERFSDSRHERSGGIVEFKGERIFDTGELLGQLHKKSGLTRATWFKTASQLSNVSLGTETILSDLKANRRKMPFNHIRPFIEALGLKKSESNYYIAELTKIYLPEKLRHLIKVTGGEHQVDVLKNRNKALESKILRLECECLYQRYGGNERTLEYLMSKSYVDSSTCLPLNSSSEEYLWLYSDFKTDSYGRLIEYKNKWLEVIKLLIDTEPNPTVIEMVKLCLPTSAPKMLGNAFNETNHMHMNVLASSPSELWSWYEHFPRPREPIMVHTELLRQYQQMYPANTKKLIGYYMAVEKINSENRKKLAFQYKFINKPNLPEGESFYHFLLKKYQSLFAQSRVLYELTSPLGDVISEDFESLESAVFNYYITFVRDNIADVERVESNLNALSEWIEEHYESCKSLENLGSALIFNVYSEITIERLHGSPMCLAEAVHQFGSAQEKNLGAFGLLQSKIKVDHSFEDIGDITFDLYYELYTKSHSQ